MGAIFGKSKKTAPSRITEQDKAVLQLKKQRDKLKQYQKRIELSLEKERLLAKELLQKGRKERALLLLKKKKYQEKLLQNTDQQLENLERLTSDIEFAQVELQVVEGLKVGNEALQNINNLLNIEEIERIMDETREGAEKQAEINSILSGVTSEDDELEILRELDELIDKEEENIARKDENPATEEEEDDDIVQNLPDVPTEEPKRKKTKETEKVAALAE